MHLGFRNKKDQNTSGVYESIVYKSDEYVADEYRAEEYKAEEYIAEIYEEYSLNQIDRFEIQKVEKEFSRKTSILNKKDISFLVIATAVLVAKGILYGEYAKKKGYGQPFDKDKRLKHNDRGIEINHRESNDRFKKRGLEKHDTGYWLNLVYQTPPYDITKGSPLIGRNMGGGYHRIHTLGHDPILGWVFGTLNIMTDVITFEDFKSFRVERKPTMRITNESVFLMDMVSEAYNLVKEEPMCLPAAVFAQAMHLESDRYTKAGLPIPILETFSPEFAGKLYKNQYDELCLKRDISIIQDSAAIALFFNMIISLMHQLFYNKEKDGSKELYEVRTRKILSISNVLGSGSNIITAIVTKNPKNLDIGGLIVTLTRLFSDIRFVTKVKKEYLESNCKF